MNCSSTPRQEAAAPTAIFWLLIVKQLLMRINPSRLLSAPRLGAEFCLATLLEMRKVWLTICNCLLNSRTIKTRLVWLTERPMEPPQIKYNYTVTRRPLCIQLPLKSKGAYWGKMNLRESLTTSTKMTTIRDIILQVNSWATRLS